MDGDQDNSFNLYSKDRSLWARRFNQGDVVYLDLYYPRENGIEWLEFDQSSVRASSGIRIRFDYDRDGYVVAKPIWDGEVVTEWREAAFVPVEFWEDQNAT